MISQLIASAIVGQVIFWRFGYDQLGVGMNPRKEFGLGRKVAAWTAARLTPDLQTAVALKVIEVVTDFGKGPLEAACYRRYGLVPDVVACAVTQPLWSTIEAAEKSVSALAYPRRLVTSEQIELSIACIYGSLFRDGISLGLLLSGSTINRLLTARIESLLKSTLKA